MTTTSIALALDRFTTFGDLLKYLRRRTGLTQRELSIAVGYSDTQISRLEQNERMPDLAVLTARFLPALQLEGQGEVAKRLLELAATMRREDSPAIGLPPYKGLRCFEETDAELFFGREELTHQLAERLAERSESDRRFLAVIGASGSGKSSLVRAGLIPTLRWRPASSGWPVILMTPTAHPLDALAAGLVREGRLTRPVKEIAADLDRDPAALPGPLERVTDAADSAHAILIVDQFEELFTLCRNEREQSAFIENLVAAAFQPDGPALVVIVLRADFYAHCARFTALRRALAQDQEFIGPMTGAELQCAIEEPARHGHWEFEPGLVDLLLHDVGAGAGHTPEPGALPLLSHALLATWLRRRGRTMTLSGYTASGGVRGAIAETAETVFYDRLELEQRDVARQIFLRLTELGGETAAADTRRRVRFDELVSKPGHPEVVREVLLTLADARLITTDQDTAEVAHEALIREWPTLRRWLQEDREGLLLHRRLTEAAAEWEALERDPGVLFRGARLVQALEWAERHAEDVNLLERDFLDASKTALERESLEKEARQQQQLDTARRLVETERARVEEQRQAAEGLRRRAVFLTLALIASVVLAGAAFVFSQRAVEANRLATSRELAAAAVSQLLVDPERSVLLALQALNDADTLEARNSLRQALPELHILLNIQAHPGGVTDLAYSPDGARLASIGADGVVKVWEPGSGELLLSLEAGLNETGSGIAFSPDGRTLAAAFVTHVVLWNMPGGEENVVLSGESVGTEVGYNLAVGQICFSPDGTRLAAANMDGVPKVWDLAERREVISLVAEMKPAKALACSPDGKLLATGGDEGLVRVWDAETGEEIRSLSLGGIIHSAAFSPDGTQLAAASEDGSVKLWEAATGRELVSLPRTAGLYDLAFLPDGSFVTAGQDGTARVWDAVTGQQMLLLAGPTSTVIGVASSPDGKRIATGAYDGSLRIWDAAPGKELLTIQGHAGIVWNVAFSPDGDRLASAGVDGVVKIWNARTGELLRTVSGSGKPGGGYTGLAFSPDGTRFAAGSEDGDITIWHSGTGEILAQLSGHSNYVVGLAFSPDGNYLASASWDGIARVWGVSGGEAVSVFTGHLGTALVSGIAFSPDGETVFTGADDRFVYQWEAATGRQVRAFRTGDKEIFGVAVSPDGRLLAAGDQDGNIHLWDAATGEALDVLSGHAGLVLRLVFNADGTRLASAGFDRLAKVWDVDEGIELFSLYGNPSNVFGVAFSPDGESLATAGADGSVRLYTMEIDRLIELALGRLTRGLELEECRKFLHLETCP